MVYRCDKTDGLVSVTFVNAEPRLVYLTRKNTRFTLERQPSGSGAKYMGGGGERFWEHRGEALYGEGNNSPEVGCKREVIV